MWWSKKKKKEAPVITEFESARLESNGVWCRIDIRIMPNGKWFDYEHDIPNELKKTASQALQKMVYNLDKVE